MSNSDNNEHRQAINKQWTNDERTMNELTIDEKSINERTINERTINEWFRDRDDNKQRRLKKRPPQLLKTRVQMAIMPDAHFARGTDL